MLSKKYLIALWNISKLQTFVKTFMYDLRVDDFESYLGSFLQINLSHYFYTFRPTFGKFS